MNSGRGAGSGVNPRRGRSTSWMKVSIAPRRSRDTGACLQARFPSSCFVEAEGKNTIGNSLNMGSLLCAINCRKSCCDGLRHRTALFNPRARDCATATKSFNVVVRPGSIFTPCSPFLRGSCVHVDEQTGEDRLMRGLAKMRELDLRLARTTQRARELKIMARVAAEQAERAAAGVAATGNEVETISTSLCVKFAVEKHALDESAFLSPALYYCVPRLARTPSSENSTTAPGKMTGAVQQGCARSGRKLVLQAEFRSAVTVVVTAAETDKQDGAGLS